MNLYIKIALVIFISAFVAYSSMYYPVDNINILPY